jgi:hypothetical protein
MFGIVLLHVAPSFAARLEIQPVASTSQGFPFVEFELLEPFEGVYADAMQSGLPTTLTFTIELWRQRGGWWDKLENAYEREFRLFRDLLSDQYVVLTPNETRRFSTLDSLSTSVCRFRRGVDNGPLYLERERIVANSRYYVVVVATLAPLTVEDLKELDAWVRSSLRGGPDDSGGISGLSRTMGGMLMSMTGFGDQRVKGRTTYFRLQDIRQAPIPPKHQRPPSPTPTPPTGVAAPDSGSGP